MSNGMCRWIRPSELLTDEALQGMLAGGEVLEQDERGYKVVRLQSGDILKIFRIRHKKSFSRIYSNARRFARNAKKLNKLGVNTVKPKQLYHFNGSENTALLYSPLVGYTVKKLLDANLLNHEMSASLGTFVAKLHSLGVHFRSLHMGNIIVTPEGEYGLIDISDMKVYWWPLFCCTRVRNFRHMTRYQKDIEKLGIEGWKCFIGGYFLASHLSARCESKLKKLLANQFDNH